jgi:hypothetical protein
MLKLAVATDGTLFSSADMASASGSDSEAYLTKRFQLLGVGTSASESDDK